MTNQCGVAVVFQTMELIQFARIDLYWLTLRYFAIEMIYSCKPVCMLVVLPIRRKNSTTPCKLFENGCLTPRPNWNSEQFPRTKKEYYSSLKIMTLASVCGTFMHTYDVQRSCVTVVLHKGFLVKVIFLLFEPELSTRRELIAVKFELCSLIGAGLFRK